MASRSYSNHQYPFWYAILYTLGEEEFAEPSIRQLDNYLAQLKKKLNGKRQVSYADLGKWCHERTKIPEDEHEVFVLDYQIVLKDLKPDLSYFTLAFGTRYLLRLATYSIHLVTDSTHCMIWNGFPVFQSRLIKVDIFTRFVCVSVQMKTKHLYFHRLNLINF